MVLIKVAYFLLCGLCLFLIGRGLNYGIKNSSLNVTERARFRNRFYILLIVWILLISALALTGFLGDFEAFPPRFVLVLFPPMIGLLIFTIRSKQLKAVLKAIPVHWLLYLQSFRVVVELMLWYQYELGITPIQMTFEGRNFDILVGITGPIIAYLYQKKGASMRKWVIAWNFFGLALLGNILVIAILSFPTPLRYFMNEPSNYLVTQFPFVWLPGILVSIAYSMHYFSLKQNWRSQ